MDSTMDVDDGASKDSGFGTLELPGPDFPLNVCLVQIANGLTDDDLECMKYLLRGDQGSGKKVLEKITKPLLLFEHLRGRCLLSRDNILFLQAMLYHAGRIDLFNKLKDFAKHRGNTIHCFPAPEGRVNGYRVAKFHVGGIGNFDRNKLEHIRSTVAEYLSLPSYLIVVAGLTPTQSLFITFLIPENIADTLIDMEVNDKRSFLSLGIDYIFLGDTQIFMEESDREDDQEQPFHIQDELDYHFKQMKSLQRQLEHYQLKELHSKEAKTNITPDIVMSLTLIATLLFNSLQRRKEKTSDLSSTHNESAYATFRHMMKKVKNMGYNPEIIEALLDANGIVVRKHMQQMETFMLTQQHIQIQSLRHALGMAKFEIEKLKYLLGNPKNQITAEEDAFGFSGTTFLVTEVTLGIGVTTRSKMISTFLRKMSSVLTEEQKQKIRTVFKINPREENHIQRHSDVSFLEMLALIEQRKKGSIDLDSIGKILIATVRNKEFQQRWMSGINSIYELPEAVSPPVEKSADRPKLQAKHKLPKQKEDTEKMDTVLEKLDLMMRRITNIENSVGNPLQRFFNEM